MSKSLASPSHAIEGQIVLKRGHRVMLDFDIERFPDDFVMELSPAEVESLRSQSVILKMGRGGHSKYPPLAFTEQGVAMLSSVVRRPRAIQVNIEVVPGGLASGACKRADWRGVD